MQQFWQQVVSGLASGAIYASLALALALVYRASGVINFAQGEMAMFSTYVALAFINHGLSYWAAFFAAIAVSFAGGVAVERAAIRPVEGAPVLSVVIVTIGLLVIFNGLASWIWTAQVQFVPSGFSGGTVDIGGVTIGWDQIGVIGVTLGAMLAFFLFFRYTRVGLRMRAAALNREASRLLGIRVSWMLALGWGFAAVLGAVSGMLIAPINLLTPNMMQAVLLYAFAAAVLGGLGSPVGAVVGGLGLGVTLNLLGTYVDFVTPELKLPLALGILLTVLLVRPWGLFGTPAVRRA
jgi:branched-chain amino acid transport system permease protein